MKICSECKQNKELNEFHKCRASKDGLKGQCKKCINNHWKKYYKLNRERYIEYQRKHHKRYYIKNRKYLLEYQKERYKNNREHILECAKKWNTNNKERRNIREAKRRKEDIQYKLTCYLRNRIRGALKNNRKSGSAVRDLGCSIVYLRKYIESQFQSNMSWNNWGFGNDKWNIDHIKPLSKLDLTNRKQFLEACHYTNLQPMWQPENFKKNNKITLKEHR